MRRLLILSTLFILLTVPLFSQEVEQSFAVSAKDHGWDGGDKIDVEWQLPTDFADKVETYKIYRSNSEDEINALLKDEKSKAV